MITAKMLHAAYLQAYDETVRASLAKAGIPCPRSNTWEEICDKHHQNEKAAYDRMAGILNEWLGIASTGAVSVEQAALPWIEVAV